jgi:alpha-L-arabinofuranosidase
MSRRTVFVLLAILGILWVTAAEAGIVVRVEDQVIAARTPMGYNIGPYNTPWDGNFVTANLVTDATFEDGPSTGEDTASRKFQGCSKGWHIECWSAGFVLTPSLDSTAKTSGNYSQRIDITTYTGQVQLGTWPEEPRALAGHRHTFKARMKASGLTGSVFLRVSTNAGSFYSPPINPTSEWGVYSWDWVPASTCQIIAIEIAVRGAGTLWVDDYIAYDADNTSPNGFPLTLVNRLKAAKASVLRWGSLYVNPFTLPEATFRPWGMEYGPPAKFGLPEFLTLCADVGADALLTIPPNFTDAAHRKVSYAQGLADFYQEHLDLLDYIGGGTSTTWGQVRAGQGLQPWNTRIGTIYFELGNELWNSMASPFTMSGAQYGDYCRKRAQAMKMHPSWKPNYRVGFGGHWASSNSEWGFDYKTAAAAGGYLDFFTETVYFPWTPTFAGFTTSDSDETVYSALFATPLERYIGIPARQSLIERAAGRRLDMLVYEANSEVRSSNDWGWWGEGRDPFFSKNHSIGAGVATLDLFAKIGSLGIRHYCWYSAVSKDLYGAFISYPEFAPRVEYLAHLLLNTELGGSVLSTTTTGAPTWDDRKLPLAGIPYVEGYGYREGENEYSVLIINRHRTQAQQVTVYLPSQSPAGEATLVRLTSPNINDNNNAGEVVRIQRETISGFTNPYTLEVPPFSACILKTSASANTLPNVTISISAASVPPNTVVTYTITYQNPMDQPIDSKPLRIPIPEHLTYVEGSASNGGCYDAASRNLVWTTSLPAHSGAATVSFQATVD